MQDLIQDFAHTLLSSQGMAVAGVKQLRMLLAIRSTEVMGKSYRNGYVNDWQCSVYESSLSQRSCA